MNWEPDEATRQRMAEAAIQYHAERNKAVPPIPEQEADRLAKLAPHAYDLVREHHAEELGIRLTTLDKMVIERRKKLPAPAKEKATTLAPDELKRTASHIIEHDHILDLFAKEFCKVIAGETVNGKLLYLIATSRLLDKTMHAAIKGTSAGGKSEIRKRIIEFFPPESVVSFTSMSEKALIYYDGDFAHKILSMGEATATDDQGFQDYLLRELMSEDRISHKAPQKVGNEIITISIEKEGPVAFLVTTTKNKLHPENETRMLSLEIDDSEKQTRSVLSKVAQVEGLNRSTAQIDYKPWQDFQRWLELGERRVIVPFAEKMADLIPAASVRLRRDIGQVIRAIKAHALLHRDRRGRDANGYIVADIERDYDPVRQLLDAILAEGSGVAVNKAMTETIEAVRQATINLGEMEGASAQDIALALKLDKSAAWRRLSAARNEGFVVNLEQRKGMPGKYRVTPQKIEPVVILPPTEKLMTVCRDTPLKPVQPCNRDGIADIYQEDNGCKDGCKTGADDGATIATVATALQPPVQPIKSLNGNGESLPVARFQQNGGGYAGDNDALLGHLVAIGFNCAQCRGGPVTGTDAPTIRVGNGGTNTLIHPECRQYWGQQ